mgnify:FL=1
MTTIYFIRHSKADKDSIFYRFLSPLKQNMKKKLSKDGISIAQNKLNSNFDDVEVIYSSNYTRAYQTSLILSKRLNLKVIKDSKFGERVHGIKKGYNELPKDFEVRQLKEENYKINNGESQKEVRIRMLKALNNILRNNKNKKIAVFTHSTALSFLLLNWCSITEDGIYIFNGNVIFDNKWSYCETFKFEFDDDNKLISIQNIK